MKTAAVKWTSRTICKKVHRAQYAAVRDDLKPFEIRAETDTKYFLGDRLCLHQWDEDAQEYVGAYRCRLQRLITYVVRECWGLPKPLVVLGLSKRKRWVRR